MVMMLDPWEDDEEPDESSPISMPGISCLGKFMLIAVVVTEGRFAHSPTVCRLWIDR